MFVNGRSNKKLSTSSHGLSRPHHGYHLVDPSPWPALTRLCVMWMLVSLVLVFHQYAGAPTLALIAFLAVNYSAFLWWRDVNREGMEGFHTSKVKNGLHLGMMLFIWSERMFFVGLLWAFLHAALMPTIQVGMSWPPVGIVPVHWTALPRTNTILLLRSYFTANAAKHAMDHNNKSLCKLHLRTTIGLGLLFVYCQYLEYTGAAFTFSDTVFGSAFYLTTGFHGLHVILGFLYLTVCYITLNSAAPGRCTAMDLAILYWHFVDVVWVGLLVIIYIWGCAVPRSELEACADGSCALYTVLYERKSHEFAHPTL
uniref:Cytochrome c oxidase subunit 3 n=1 Tax=Tetradesmus obliquus TaxID=3088 RepID=Q9MD26_TETOB|nr:cytochrome oxidase subunit 3 [Tetradesmus obliquus]AAF72056.1 cytochrome c oxidase subunit 3 [Tetradesmus obliquus]CAB77708.2 cytochrome c oxidase subunit 3 [Tetradesmus obliquus]CAB90364.1 cytochrome oxidase subunit 3 [Tetradesmus obliquus]